MGRIIWDEKKDKLLLDTYDETSTAREALRNGHGIDNAYWKLIASYMRAEGVEGSPEAMRKRYSFITAPIEEPVAVPTGKHYRVGQYCILRCKEAGVHAGFIEDYDPATGDARVSQCRRLWKWDSRFTLSELAQIGVRNSADCKFSIPVDDATICGVCELLVCSAPGCNSIRGVPNANEK